MDMNLAWSVAEKMRAIGCGVFVESQTDSQQKVWSYYRVRVGDTYRRDVLPEQLASAIIEVCGIEMDRIEAIRRIS